MTKLDAIKTIFQMFLYFLTEKAVDILLKHCLLEQHGDKVAKEIVNLLNASADELRELVEKCSDEEDKVAYLNVGCPKTPFLGCVLCPIFGP